jgi:hypothetical protein
MKTKPDAYGWVKKNIKNPYSPYVYVLDSLIVVLAMVNLWISGGTIVWLIKT